MEIEVTVSNDFESVLPGTKQGAVVSFLESGDSLFFFQRQRKK